MKLTCNVVSYLGTLFQILKFFSCFNYKKSSSLKLSNKSAEEIQTQDTPDIFLTMRNSLRG